MDILGFLYNFFVILIAGLCIAFSPLLIITDVFIVLRSKRPILHTLVLLGSMAAPLVLLGLLASSFIRPDSEIRLSIVVDTLSVPPLFTSILGLVLILIAWRRFQHLRYRAGSRIKAVGIKTPPTSLIPLSVFGFTKSLLSATNVFAILLVTKLIVTQDLAPLTSIIVLCWTIAVGFIPFFIVIYYHHNRRDILLQLEARVETRLSTNIQLYITIAFAAIGGLLVIESLLRLLFEY